MGKKRERERGERLRNNFWREEENKTKQNKTR